MARSILDIMIREMVKSENLRRREAIRLQKENEMNQIKVYNAHLREQAKAEKEQYVALKLEQAEKMTAELLQSYKKYTQIIANQLETTEIFTFDNLKQLYEEVEFVFLEEEPTKDIAYLKTDNLVQVPKENWLEKIFASRKEKRLSIIEENNIKIQEFYKEIMVEYEKRKQSEKSEWETTENLKRIEIDKNNTEVDSLGQAYLSGDEEAILAYIDILFSVYNFALDTIVEHQSGYNKYVKKLIIDLHIANKEEIFEAEGYKYIKQRDEFDTIKMKVTVLNERMKSLMIEVCIATFHLLYRNDIANHFNIITVNVFYDHVCCVSGEVDRETFVKHNFTTRSGMAAFLELQMRVFKQISSGVKPFDILFSALE